jgi:hypothetical protein
MGMENKSSKIVKAGDSRNSNTVSPECESMMFTLYGTTFVGLCKLWQCYDDKFVWNHRTLEKRNSE